MGFDSGVNAPLQPASEPATGYAAAFEGRQFASARTRLDLPTLVVAVAIFGGYGLLTLFFRDMPLWISAPLTALWLAWYGSLQHETIHNHPTPSRRLNAALGSLPLGLWLPYQIYRVTHRRHHRQGGRRLTEVSADPESFFLTPGSFKKYGWLRRALYRANCTLAGRLTLGPALSLYRFWAGEVRLLEAGDRYRRYVWLRHFLAAALVVWWITQICHIPILVYCACVVYPSIALSHLRSFTEHRVDPDPTLRTVTVEAGRLWSLLFLNNNLHIAHHARPDVPWYQLPQVWHRMRPAALRQGLVFDKGYPQVAQKYLVNAVIEVEHPAACAEGKGPP